MSPVKHVEAVAIVGLQAELPSGTHAEHNLSRTEFYKFLLEKNQSYETIPLDRFKASAWRGSNLGEIITDKGSFLKDIDCFDHVELGVSMKDARNMALSSRKLLEMSFLALLDSGIDYRARNVGVYMAGVPFDLHSLVGPSVLEAVGSFSGSPAQIANRISYHLDLLGPSVPTDNACSSSLTALHLAVQALRVGDCEAAVVGGCQLNHRFVDWVQYSHGHVLSPDGKCKPFDESANGFSRGEGAVAIVIKRLSDAVRDGDHIYATILGTGINSGGGAAPVSAPIARAQEDAMERAYHGTGHDPRQVDFVEMHATGTAAGDPTEANWVGRRFGRPDGAELMVGSVKGNIGHLEITSFLASLCKVCSMLEHGVIPPNVNLSTLNPAITWDKYSMRVPTEPTPLHVRDAAGRALVSICGSGIGGTNGHVVVQSPPPCTSADELLEDDGQSAVLFFAGGLSPRSAAAVSQQLKDYLSASQCTDLRSIAYTLGRRTRQMTWRSFCVYHSGDPVVMSDPKMAPRIHPPIVFVLSGQGPQHISMGRQLLRYKAFKDSVQSMDIVHERVTGVSLIKTYGMFSANDIGASQALPTIWPISIILPALAILQIGLVDLLRSVGIAPDALIGHSAGETVVMYASGSIPREMAVEIAIARGTALALTERLDGSMAALGCRPSLARQIVDMVMANKSGTLDIACYNAADAVTLSGSADLIDEAVKVATDRGIFARRLRTGVAVHSSLMDHCKSSYEESVRFIFERYASSIVAPSTAIYSAVTGKRWNNAFTPEYMWHNNRRPVLFSGAVSALLDTLPGAMFVEISPHPALSSYILAHGVSPEHVSCPLRRCKPGNRFEEHEAFLRSTAELIIMGSNAIDFRVLTGTSRVTEDFPAYPFVRKQVPYYPDYAPSIREQFRVRDGPLRYPNLRINKATHPDLAQHIIRNESIMPAAGYLEMVFETGANIVWDLKFTGMMPILEDKLLDVDFVVAGVHRWSITSRMHAPLSDTMERTHASGFMATNVADGGSWPVIDVRSIMERCRKVDIPDMYEHISYFAQYGPLFQRMHSFFIGKDEGIVCVQGFDAHLRPGYVVNPAILDAAFHPIILPIVTSNVDRNSYYLPSAIAYVQLHRGISKTDSSLYSYYQLKRWTPNHVVFDIVLFSHSGEPIVTLNGFEIARHLIKPCLSVPERRFCLVYQPVGLQALSSESLDIKCEQSSEHTAKHVFDIINDVFLTSGKKVIRFLDASYDNDGVVSVLSSMVAEALPSDVIVEYHGCGSSASERTNSRVRIHPKIPSSTQSSEIHFIGGLDTNSCDIILAVDELTDTADAQTPFVHFSRFLVAGGILVVNLDTSCSEEVYRASGLTLIPTSASCVLRVFQRSVPVYRPVELLPLSLWAIHFHHDVNISAVQERLSDLASDCKVLWVIASSTLDVAAARGFSRSLRHELRNTVRLRAAFFAIERSYQDMLSFVQYIEDTGFTSDDEIFVDDKNVITVPRIIPSPPPSSRTITSFHDTLISCQLELHHVVVEVAQFGASGAGLAGVVGRVIRVGPHTSLQVDAIVYAIVSVPTEGVLVIIHEGQAVDASKLGLHFPVALILPLFVCAAALGILSLLHPERFDSKSVVIVNDFEHGRVMGDVITILKRIDWNVQQIDAAVSEAGLQALGSADFVISGTTLPSDEEILRGCTQRGCRIFFCTSRHHGLPYLIECHPWTVFDALTALADPLAPVISSIKAIEGTSCHNDVHATPADDRLLFPQNETFLLIGGLGSLGIQIACWLYAKGARHIVLTSRSGGIRDDSATNYPRLQYLQELSDLSLTIEKCDASFLENVLRVVQKITPRIGGCILLSGLLNDRMFTSHDPKSYREAFPPKVGAFKALECALSISSLRFFITISTIITCGSTGQTSYSSANSVLEELTSKYRNAFSLVAPFILDTPFFFHGDKFEFNHRYDDLALSGMTREEVCQALEDGILKLQDGPFQSSLYYPDIDWAALSAALGPSQLYGHLVTVQETSENIAGNANKEKRSAEEIIQIVRASLDVPPEDFSVDVPFTSYGLDSLLAARISQSLKPYIQVTQMQLLGNMTLTDLLTAIQKAEQNPDLQELSSNRLKTIQSMVDKYVAQLPDDQDTDQYDGYAVFEGKCVLVTGTTGALGSYVLGALSSDASISKVYALNRTGEDPLFERQKAALEARGIDPNILHDRIILLEVDYAADMLGLSVSLYAELAQSVTHVVHNAWRVDLARDITAFDDNLQTLIALIRLALNARARLTFIGTVAVLGRGPKNVPCPEEHIEGSYALTNGYSASKWIGEQIIKAAVTKFSSCIRKGSRMFGATILRVGQLCADQDGRWSPSEWVPLLIRSAKALRCLPLDDGTVSWTPIDVAAHAIVDIACADTVPPPIVHLAHPHPVPWHLLAQKMGAILDIPVLPFAQWLNCVESSYHPDAFDEIPVLKAIDMFRGAAPDIASDHLEAFGLARMDLTNLMSLSPTMSNPCLRKLQEDDVEKWLRYCKV